MQEPIENYSADPCVTVKKKSRMHHLLIAASVLGLLGLLVLLAAFFYARWWMTQKPVAFSRPQVVITVEKGDNARTVVNKVCSAGVDVNAWGLMRVMIQKGTDKKIHAGRFELKEGMTPEAIALTFSNSAAAQMTSFQIADGTNIWTLRKALYANPDIVATTRDMDLMHFSKAVGIEEGYPEGWLAPETYKIHVGASDVEVLKVAYQRQKQLLDKLWQQRDPTVLLETPYQALILASIIEKETSRPEDRGLVSSVFHNRLKKGMKLQTDPTVIYGQGETFEGRLRKKHLQQPTAYNTYTNFGLTPTPIAMPTEASIHAALHPEKTDYYYFVSRGDGVTHFTRTLGEHNKAVDKYQRGK